MAKVQSSLRFKIKKNPQNKLSVKSFYGPCKENINEEGENSSEKCVNHLGAKYNSVCVKNDNEIRTMVTRKRTDLEPTDRKDDTCSPPKREKSVQPATPTTTPSQLLMNFNISTPSETKTSQEVKILTPRKLFEEDPAFQHARQALHCTSYTGLPGREDQLHFFKDYLHEHLKQNKSGTVYVSGPPGTGKTACLNKVMELDEVKNSYKIVYINCTTMKTSYTIYSRICSQLNLKTAGKTVKEYAKSIENLLTNSKKMMLFILDEIDQLDSRNQAVLYTLFEWPSKSNSKLVLIGIANSLDLTDRVLPRLQAHVVLKPKLIHFPPYTKQQIVDILSSRLSEFNVNQVFSPAVVHLLAAKVASISGDARRALDIGRRVIEIAEARQNVEPLPLQTINEGSNPVSPRKSPRKNSSCVDIKLVMEVLNNIYGTSQSLSDDSDAFPIQQKVLVCTLLLMLKNGPNKDISLAKLHEVYRRVCNKRNLLPVDQAEFKSLCQMVEIRGIIKLQGAHKIARLIKVCLQWDEEEVAAALKDRQLLAAIMHDKSVVLP